MLSPVSTALRRVTQLCLVGGRSLSGRPAAASRAARLRVPLTGLLWAALAISASAQGEAPASLSLCAQLVGVSCADLSQTGASNTARLTQNGASSAVLVQDGDGNLIAGVAGGEYDPLGSVQSTDGSLLFVTQLGTGNEAYVDQWDASSLTLLQSGVKNVALVEQGGGAFALVTQIGTGNVVTIRQSP